MKSNKAFTLVELLVVVLIIGILAAIAVPQYQKAVLKANLHKGVSLVESLYEAQQAYFLAHGEFTNDLTQLDITLPADCGANTKTKSYQYRHSCDFGVIYSDTASAKIYFLLSDSSGAYVKYLQDYYSSSLDYTFKGGHIYCYARPDNQLMQDVCINMSGKYFAESNSWKYYALD